MQELSALLSTCNLCLHASVQTTIYLHTLWLALIIAASAICSSGYASSFACNHILATCILMLLLVTWLPEKDLVQGAKQNGTNMTS